MSNKLNIAILLLILSLPAACSKQFLDKKPSTNIVTPSTLSELQALLDNSTYCNSTSALVTLSADEYYFLDYDNYLAERSITTRNAYIWLKDLYDGGRKIPDWNEPYNGIFIANSVLSILPDIVPSTESERQLWKHIKGWAMFIRSYLFFDLVKNFSPAYDELTASADLGIPLKLTANIDEIVQRSSVLETYNRIISDLKEAVQLLSAEFPYNNRNRPSKVAAYAMLSRVFLSMRKYQEAEVYADSCLNMYNSLIDYNNVSTTSATPFGINNEESIFSSHQVFDYLITTTSSLNTSVSVDTNLIQSYDHNDLRLLIFYRQNSQGTYSRKRDYYGSGNYPYSGLATDEMILVKAECLARRGEYDAAMETLNQLLVKRYKSGAFIPLVASSSEEALNLVLNERRKELVFRGLRWMDLKRLNKEGFNITLERELNGVKYVLPPNDPRYVFPIPDDEIALSGIQQNLR